MIRLALVSSLVVGLPCAAAAKDGASHELNVGSLSVTPDRVRAAPQVEIDLMLVIEPGNVRHYRFDRRMTDREGKVATSFADSRECAAASERLSALEMLEMPGFVAPGSELLKSAPILLHATTYRLSMGGYEAQSDTAARIELTAQSGSPLAQWSEATLLALEPCWNSTAN